MAIAGKISTITLPSGLQYELGNGVSIEMLASEYDSNENYDIGDYCSYENKLYKAIHPAGSGNFDSGDWVEVTVMGEISERCTFLPAAGMTF